MNYAKKRRIERKRKSKIRGIKATQSHNGNGPKVRMRTKASNSAQTTRERERNEMK